MRFPLLLLLGLLPLWLIGQTPFPQSPPETNAAGAAPAITASHILDQAYTNMLTGNYKVAEQQYKSLTELDPTNSSGWEGLLWAQNSLGKYRQTLKLSKELLKKNPGSAYPYNYRAYALNMQKRFPEARYYYQKGLMAQPGNPLANQISREGLALAYLNLDDQPNYALQQEKALALASKEADKSKPGVFTTLSYKLPGKDKSAYGVKQGISYQNQALSLGYEDFHLSGQSFRSSYKLSYRLQLPALDFSISGNVLDGKDTRVYPGRQAALELSPKLYPAKISLRPAVQVSYSRYPRFDVQQISFKPRLQWRDIGLRYALHAVNLDHEIQNADSLRLHQQIEISKSLPWDFSLGLNYGSGNDTWSLDSAGNLIDTFNQMGNYYGVSLSKSLFNRLFLYAYYQGWKSEQLYYFSLSGRY